LVLTKQKTVAVIATGWIGDTIACTAAASSLYERGYRVTFFTRWPQLKTILENDGRFKAITYPHIKFIKFFKWFIDLYFDKVVWEPTQWSYLEPFTSEIRRLAGCEPRSEYELCLGDDFVPKKREKGSRPLVAFGRDIYKRAYGRDVDQFVKMLSEFADIEWIGLAPEKNSKHGKGNSLLQEARRIASADIFLGPEGGLLWLAAGIGKRCVYFSENIQAVADRHSFEQLDNILGSKNHFPDANIHTALPSGCSNQQAIALIQSAINCTKRFSH
jgi:hypothetical protein